MNIFETSRDPSILQLKFTDEEEENSLFQTALNKIREAYEIVGDDGTVDVELSDARTINIIADNIDNIRQILCGDVDPTADLSECPFFIIGDTDPVPELEEI